MIRVYVFTLLFLSRKLVYYCRCVFLSYIEIIFMICCGHIHCKSIFGLLGDVLTFQICKLYIFARLICVQKCCSFSTVVIFYTFKYSSLYYIQTLGSFYRVKKQLKRALAIIAFSIILLS